MSELEKKIHDKYDFRYWFDFLKKLNTFFIKK